MKAHLLTFVISSVAFVAATYLLPGLNYHGDSQTLVRAAVVFSLLNTFVRPIVNLILLPINFMTLGLLGGVTGLVMLWLVSVLVEGFVITDSVFPGTSLGFASIPSYEV